MPEQFTEVTTTGWGANILKSIKGVIVGIILFLLAFLVLWLNEGRMDMSKIAKQATVISPDKIEVVQEAVSVTGQLTSLETLGDPSYLVPGNYILVNRKAEMFAWIEKQSTKTEKKIGGKEVKTTIYTYIKEWTAEPQLSSTFKQPKGHQNLLMIVKSKSFRVSKAKIGVYNIDTQSIRLPEPRSLILNPEIVILPEGGQLTEDYIFKGKGTFTEPEIGDLRISFEVVNSDIQATVFGQLSGSKIQPYFYKDKHKLYRAIQGTHQMGVVKMAQEHRILTWILRLVGFLLMWIGLSLFFGPINAVLDFLPFLGGLGRGLVALAMLLAALVISGITILVAIIAHNLLVLIITLVVIFGIVWFFSKKKRAEELNK